MTQTNRFWMFALLSAGLVLLMTLGLLGYIWLHLAPDRQAVLLSIFQEHVYTLLILVFVLFSAFWVVSDITYYRYIRPVKRMSAEAAMIYASNPSHRIALTGNHDIRTMASVINDFADMFENLNKTITEQILAARKETEKERNLLAAIMGELPHGVIICNKSGRILLFNSLANKIFTHTDFPGKTEHYMGLGRSIFHLVDKGLIAHAMEEIAERLELGEKSAGSYFITPIYTGCLISVEAIPVLDRDNLMTGFILAFQEVSQDIEKYEAIEKHLARFKAFLKSGVRDCLDLVRTMPRMSPETYRSLQKQLQSLDTRFGDASESIQDISLSRLPLTSLALGDFLSIVQKRTARDHDIRINIFSTAGAKRLQADTYSLSRAFAFLFQSLIRLTNEDEISLNVSAMKDRIRFDITWDNPPVLPISDIQALRSMRINALPGFDYVLRLNNARLHILETEPGKAGRISISTRARSERISPSKLRSPVLAGSRPEFYDFNLFKINGQPGNILDTRLTELTFTVFDTETTGLNPEGGDEIISIGAVRIVNNRIQHQDIFEELVDPKRDIPIESYRIHGISHDMVAEKDDIEKVLPRFSTFVSNTVLVGHNIAFDLKMLKLKEHATGIAFTNPVLDTLLLSAVLHPVHVQHDMENIAKRLGVNIIGRHTALGDALTTAEIFLKLVPILSSNGILTLRDTLAASKKTYYARLKY